MIIQEVQPNCFWLYFGIEGGTNTKEKPYALTHCCQISLPAWWLLTSHCHEDSEGSPYWTHTLQPGFSGLQTMIPTCFQTHFLVCCGQTGFLVSAEHTILGSSGGKTHKRMHNFPREIKGFIGEGTMEFREIVKKQDSRRGSIRMANLSICLETASPLALCHYEDLGSTS